MRFTQSLKRDMLWFLSGVIAAVPLLLAPITSAQSYAQNIIHCGLQAGVNLDFSQLDRCTMGDNSSDGPSTAPPTGTSTTTPNNTGSTRYVALGDSVAAGLGLPRSDADQQCGRSGQSYAYQVAAATGTDLQHIACSGATAGDLVTKQAVTGPNIPAQLDQAFAGGTPKLITITAGANDAHWADFIRACYATDCSGTAATTLADAYLEALRLKLNYALNDISASSQGQPPQVVMTGYYNPVSLACSTRIAQVSDRELTWISTETAKLNQVIQRAAATHSSFVRFVPISFIGHDICSGTPWVQGLNDPAPFHPTAIGQAQIAQAVIKAINTTNY